VADIAQPARGKPLPPDIAGPPLLPDPRLVLAPDFKPLGFRIRLRNCRQAGGKPLLSFRHSVKWNDRRGSIALCSLAVPPPDRPRSSSMMTIRSGGQPSSRALLASAYCRSVDSRLCST
jgi:hypothetical protein